MPRQETKLDRSRIIAVRLTSDELTLIDTMAAAESRTTTNFCRRLIRDGLQAYQEAGGGSRLVLRPATAAQRQAE